MRTAIASPPPPIIIRLTHNAQFLCARPVFSSNFTTTWRGWFSELLTFTDEETKTQRGKGNLFIVPHQEIMEAGFHVQPGFRLLSESLFTESLNTGKGIVFSRQVEKNILNSCYRDSNTEALGYLAKTILGGKSL